MNYRRPVLPSDAEVPVQMSPFGDDRWDLDVEENRRRKEIHRDYVYNLSYRKPTPSEPPQEYIVPAPLPPEPVIQTTNQAPETNAEVPGICDILPTPKYESEKKDFFKYEPPKIPKFKTFAEIPFESPGPPNLFPVLKFPEKKITSDKSYRLSEGPSYVTPVAGVPLQVEAPELPPRPQFSTYQDVKFEREKVVHYGVHVPFWQFSNNDNVTS